ncbi:MAG: D-alanyl-D-alanine carboxypeptidase [Hyphomicrobiales bacterium]
MTAAVRMILSLVLVVALAVTAPTLALAAPPFSALTIDARTGKVLYAKDADGLRHPASLTKMMTLYILFQDLKSGKITLKSPIRMSARAASRPPTKLGVKPGGTIPVELAIRALVVKSANDVASAVAENLGGTEDAFAKRMTKTAKALGMTRTTFRNASGLPDPDQWTTARDMATLGLRLMRDFPEYYPYFRTLSFTYAGKTVATHNRLLKNYKGTDGIKTGYIAASGFNLVSSVRRGDKRVVGVVLGGKTGNSRNAYMMKMLTEAFPKAKGGKTIAALAGSSKGVVAEVADADADNAAASTTPEPSIASLSEAAEAAGDAEDGNDEVQVSGATVKPAQVPEAQPRVIDGSVGAAANLPFQVKPKVTQGQIDQVIAAMQSEDWIIQTGAYRTKRDAQAQIKILRTKLPDLLAGKDGFTVTVQKGELTTYRARFSGFSEEGAKAACESLASQLAECHVVAPAS